MTKEYINKKYGKLTVTSISDKKHKRGIVLNCTCDCGNIIEKVSADLAVSEKVGSVPSCGCGTEKDFTGKKYGKLTAISKVCNKPGLGVLWKFKCDCGNEIEKIGSQVSRLEGKLHCGCSEKKFTNTKDEVGNRYGKLTVTKYSKNDHRQRALWICKCDCGNEIEEQGARLRRGVKTHCGCQKSDLYKNKNIKETDLIPVSYWNRVKKNAETRNFEFKISIEDIHNKYIEQNGICALSGVEMFPPKNLHNKNPNKASLDRIDSTLGYTKDNIQWITSTINIIKSDLKENDFVEICRRVTGYKT